MIVRTAHRRVRAAAAVAAYPRRPERDAVRAAHRGWIATTGFDEPLTFEAYQSALDREERAAEAYARVMSRVRHPAETGPAHQLASSRAFPGAWERR